MNKLSETMFEIAIIFAKNFSDALLQTASDLSKRLETNSQASIIDSTSPPKHPTEIENPEYASLAIGDKVLISVIHRKRQQKGCGLITALSPEKITVTNDLTNKTWEVPPDKVLYKFVQAYEIE